MGFRDWIEKDHSQSIPFVILSFLLGICIETVICFVLAVIPLSLIYMACTGLGVPECIWNIIHYPCLFFCMASILFLWVRKNFDESYILCLLRGKFR